MLVAGSREWRGSESFCNTHVYVDAWKQFECEPEEEVGTIEVPTQQRGRNGRKVEEMGETGAGHIN